MKIVLPVFCFFLLCCTKLAAQQIPLTMSFAKHVAAPVTFEMPGEKRSILFFYAVHNDKAEFYAIETDDSLHVLRHSEITSVKASKMDETVKFIGSFHQRGSEKYILLVRLGNREIWTMELDRKSFAVTAVKVLDKPANTVMIGGITAGEQYCLLFGRKEKKKKFSPVIIYESADGKQFSEHSIDVISEMKLFEKKYSPVFPTPEIEQEPEIAAEERDKIFAGPDKIYFVSDESNDVYGYVTDRTRVIIIDLKTFTAAYQTYSCFKQQETESNRICSYVYDDKLFQMGLMDNYFSLEIFDLTNKTKVFSKILREKDSLNQLLNSDVIVPGRGILSVEKSYTSPDKFSKKMLQLTPFIQVRKSGDDYIVGMGGYEEEGTHPGNPVPVMPNRPVSVTTSILSYYERATFFYAVIKTGDFSHSSRFISNSIQKQIKAATEENPFWFTENKSPDIFYLFGRQYIGKYDRKKDAYILTKLQPE